jgi:hypothetical protein
VRGRPSIDDIARQLGRAMIDGGRTLAAFQDNADVLQGAVELEGDCDVDGETLKKGRETLRVSDLVIGAAVLVPAVLKIAMAVRERIPALSRDRDDLDAA